MMNLVQIQDRLKGMADDHLVQYMKAPDGSVPPYLALTEISRRNKMRRDFVTDQKQPSTVAQDLVSATEGGAIAPAPSVGIEKQLPEGPAFAEGGIANFYYPFEDDIRDSRLTRWGKKLGNAAAVGYQAPVVLPNKVGSGIMSGIQGVGDYLMDTPYVPYEENPELRNFGKRPAQTEIVNPDPVSIPQMHPDRNLERVPDIGAKKIEEASESIKDATAALTMGAVGGGGGGISDFYGDIEADIDTRSDAAKADRDQGKWLALAQAGFGIASGDSDRFLQNVARGGIEGIAALNVVNKDYREAMRAITAENLEISKSRADDARAGAQIAASREGNMLQLQGQREAIAARTSESAADRASNVEVAEINAAARQLGRRSGIKASDIVNIQKQVDEEMRADPQFAELAMSDKQEDKNRFKLMKEQMTIARINQAALGMVEDDDTEYTDVRN